MTDDEWVYFEPFLTHRGGRPPHNHRRVLDGVFWLMRTGAPWRDSKQGKTERMACANDDRPACSLGQNVRRWQRRLANPAFLLRG